MAGSRFLFGGVMPTSLATMRTAVLREADLQAGQVTPAEVDALLNDHLAELHELIATAHEDQIVATSDPLIIATGAESVALPSTFWRAISVTDMSGPFDLTPVEWRDRHAPPTRGYCVFGSSLYVCPKSVAPGTYTLHFVPTFTRLVLDADTVTYPNGWELYGVLGAAIRLRNMQELTASGLEERRDRVLARIQNVASQRKGSRKVRDVRGGSRTRFDEGYDG